VENAVLDALAFASNIMRLTYAVYLFLRVAAAHGRPAFILQQKTLVAFGWLMRAFHSSNGDVLRISLLYVYLRLGLFSSWRWLVKWLYGAFRDSCSVYACTPLTGSAVCAPAL